MSHIISVVSMLGGQTQTRSANSAALLSNAAAGIPVVIPDASGDQNTPGVADAIGSPFQLMLSNLLPQSAVSQTPAATTSGAGSTDTVQASDDEESPIALPFPLTENDLPIPAENSSVSAIISFSPFMLSSALPIHESAPVPSEAAEAAKIPDSTRASVPAQASPAETSTAAGTRTQPAPEKGGGAFRLVDTVPSMPQVRDSRFAAVENSSAIIRPSAQGETTAQTDSASLGSDLLTASVPVKNAIENTAASTDTAPQQQAQDIRRPAVKPAASQAQDRSADVRTIASAKTAESPVSGADARSGARISELAERIMPQGPAESAAPVTAEAAARPAVAKALEAAESTRTSVPAADVLRSAPPAQENSDTQQLRPGLAPEQAPVTAERTIIQREASIPRAAAQADAPGERALNVQAKSAPAQTQVGAETFETVRRTTQGSETRVQKENTQQSFSPAAIAQAADAAQKISPMVQQHAAAAVPEVFVELHEAIAAVAGSESGVTKHTQKTAAAQTARASSALAETDAPIAAPAAKRAQVQVKASAPAIAVQAEPVRAEVAATAPVDQQQTASTVQTKQTHEGSFAAQAANASAEVRAPRTETPASPQHPAGLVTNDMQTRGPIAQAPEAAQPLSPRVKEDVFERVFREVSSIRHTPASVDVTLSPESLGKVTVNVGMDEGKMSARINVQNTDVKQILDAAMPRLQDALHASGLALDSVAVFVNNGSSFAERRNDAPKRKAGTAGTASDNGIEGLQSAGDAKQYGYSTVEYIM